MAAHYNRRMGRKPDPEARELAELDAWLSAGGFQRAKRPKGALARSRTQRDAQRKDPLPGTKPRPRKIRGRIEVLRPEWRHTPAWLTAGFSTRTGGFSTCFGGRDLNLSLLPADDPQAVERNRAAFLAALVRDRMQATTVALKQIHSGIIHVIHKAPRQALTGDGAVTNVPRMLLRVSVADCVPVLVADPRRKVVGAFHAGWRGTVQRIVEKGIGLMRMEYESDPRDLIAAIGPCIGACCYAVGEEVVDQFTTQFHYGQELFREVTDDDPIKRKYPLLFLTARAPGHSDLGPQIHLDLVEANRRQLLAAGLSPANIWGSGLCTSCRVDRLFSHRKEGGFTGRMVGAIGIFAGRGKASGSKRGGLRRSR